MLWLLAAGPGCGIAAAEDDVVRWEVVGTTPSPEKGCERYVLKRRKGGRP